MKTNTIIYTWLVMMGSFNCLAEKHISKADKANGVDMPPSIQAKTGLDNSLLAGCAAPNAATYIDFNNVKALIFTGGDMFWDNALGARYEVPKGSGKHSMFLASLWLGGTDVNGQLRIAAQRYREQGVDFWTGPLDTSGTGEVSPETCAEWDQHFIITRQEVNEFKAWFNSPSEFPQYTIPNSILTWPAHGDVSKGQSYYLAPFYDHNGDGYYNPYDGDYPFYDTSNDSECNRSRDRVPKLFGDQTFWYIFNDKGNIHKETEGDAIGLEVHAQTFAFATNDEINNMTFSNYRIINRSTFTLVNTFFGTNFDPDIGNAYDDFVGCDVKRGLGYGYNGPAIDGGGNPGDYGENPPAIGVDFFEGPFQDPDGEDNPQDLAGSGIIDTSDTNASFTSPCAGYINGSINGLNFGDGYVDNERWGMRRFVYYCNPTGGGACNGDVQGDPETAVDYYSYLRGYWKDGTRMVYGGNGHTGDCTSCEFADFMFPGAKSNPTQTDECSWGVCSDPDGNNCGLTPGDPNPWTEQEAGNAPSDRRFVHSAGPFTLEPGAENDITVGVVWARATSTDPFQSVELVRLADDKAQALFDNCFKVLNGPDAPILSHQELNREIILYLSNPPTSNNYMEKYVERDPLIQKPDTTPNNVPWDLDYRFQGYQIFQLENKTVSVADINNIELARLVAQVDLKDSVTKLVNYEYDEAVGVDIAKLMVNGNNQGIAHSFRITDDEFALGDKKLVNHKKYYFIAIAYAYNQNLAVDWDPEGSVLLGNPKPYLAGRKSGFGGSIEPIEAIPHNPAVEFNGTQVNSSYGDSPEITRIEGQGNGGLVLDLTAECTNSILESSEPPTKITYQKNKGPIEIKVIDPLKVKGGRYYLKLYNDPNDAIPILFAGNLADTIDAGTCYFLTGTDVRKTMSVGHPFTVTGGTANDGEWTIFNIGKYGDTVFVEEHIKGNTAGGLINPFYRWALISSITHDTLELSEQGVNVRAEQIIEELGISITAEQVMHPGPAYAISASIYKPSPSAPTIYYGDSEVGPTNPDPNNGFLEISIEFDDPNKKWLTGVVDSDAPNGLNWIRAGKSTEPIDYNVNSPLDENEIYENLLGGIWGPGRLCSYDTLGPMFAYNANATNLGHDPQEEGNDRISLKNLASVDLVITRDKSKWTRSVVLELEENRMYTKPLGSNVPKLNLRAGISVDKNGIPMDTSGQDINIIPPSTNPNDANFIANTGMGWFPGYAINVETGERLNIMFGEDSWLVNGNDMIWNPTSDLTNQTGQIALNAGSGCVGCAPEICTFDNPCLPYWAGGKHYIYIMGHNGDDTTYMTNARGNVPAYDNGAYIRHVLDGMPDNLQKESVFKDVMWVGLPLLHEDFNFSDPANIPTDVKIRFRVAKSYKRNYSTDSTFAGTPANSNNPMYEFSLDEFAVKTSIDSVAQSVLEEINVVPNPYNAFSSYEESQIDHRVKIINLPVKCTISIYNLNGTLIRQFDRDDETITSVDWNLKNTNNVPIASGVYLIHVNAPGIGEKVLKWFGVLRPMDLDSF